MAATVREITDWLSTLDPDDQVGIDGGGLAIQSVSEPQVYFEIGGIPLED